jgi:ABC-type lipoprotein export system ATPase subunit
MNIIIGCLNRPTGGRYLLDDIEFSKANRGPVTGLRTRKIGSICQRYELFPNLAALKKECNFADDVCRGGE